MQHLQRFLRDRSLDRSGWLKTPILLGFILWPGFSLSRRQRARLAYDRRVDLESAFLSADGRMATTPIFDTLCGLQGAAGVKMMSAARDCWKVLRIEMDEVAEHATPERNFSIVSSPLGRVVFDNLVPCARINRPQRRRFIDANRVCF
jgi:hypothetical protein